MLEAGRSPVTVNDLLKILKRIGNFAVKQDQEENMDTTIYIMPEMKNEIP